MTRAHPLPNLAFLVERGAATGTRLYASTTCTICNDAVTEDDGSFASDAMATTCGHVFHKACLGPWVRSKRDRGEPPTCTTCRQPLSEDDVKEATEELWRGVNLKVTERVLGFDVECVGLTALESRLVVSHIASGVYSAAQINGKKLTNAEMALVHVDAAAHATAVRQVVPLAGAPLPHELDANAFNSMLAARNLWVDSQTRTVQLDFEFLKLGSAMPPARKLWLAHRNVYPSLIPLLQGAAISAVETVLSTDVVVKGGPETAITPATDTLWRYTTFGPSTISIMSQRRSTGASTSGNGPLSGGG